MNKELVGQIESKQQDSRFKPNYINNYKKFKGINTPVKRQMMSDYIKK